jgi:hypothetical protein
VPDIFYPNEPAFVMTTAWQAGIQEKQRPKTWIPAKILPE